MREALPLVSPDLSEERVAGALMRADLDASLMGRRMLGVADA